MQVREKVEKSRNSVFFQCVVAPEGRKVGSLKRRARSHLARWDMKNCSPLWREAHLRVKCRKHTKVSEHFLKLAGGSVWQAQGALHPAKSEQKRNGCF